MCIPSSQCNHSTKECEGCQRNTKFLSSSETKVNESLTSASFDAEQEKRKLMKGFGADRLLVVGGRDISSKEETSTSSAGKKILWAKKPISKLNVQDISIALAIFPEFFTQELDQHLLIHQSEKYASISNTNLTVRNQHPPSDCGGLALWFIREYGL